MATVASRMSLDPPSSLIDPHLSTAHPRVPDLAPAAHSQPRRVSSESQTPGRASPAPRISRRTPVPFLLEAFPAPPSHIPATPASVSPSTLLNTPSLVAPAAIWLPPVSTGSAVSTNPAPPSNSNPASPCSPRSVAALLPHSNPPPSSPPTGPLPPIPGPSSAASDLFPMQRTLLTTAGSASSTVSRTESPRSHSRSDSRSRISLDGNESVRGRRRQGSLSSLRNPVHSLGERTETIAEEPVEVVPPAPQSLPSFGSVAARGSLDQPRGNSVEILRPCLSRGVVPTPTLGPDRKPYVEDSIASVDMSDLNAIKSDNEGEGDEQASRPFPRFPLLPRSQPQNAIQSPASAPPYAHTPRKASKSSIHSVHVSSASEDGGTRSRAMSPEVKQIITATPRPRKRSTPSRSRDSSSTRTRKDSSRSRRDGEIPPVPTNSHAGKATSVTRSSGGGKGTSVAGEEQGNESDSSLDLHTPLPQLMLRHGMLSPNSKLLPQPEVDSARLSIMSGLSTSSYLSNASNLSLMSTTSNCSKHAKDARDTPRRRVRHRDGKLLKGGIGLTTGLGWSDSEDEDAPSALTRRVSTLVLSRRASSSSIASQPSSASPLPRSVSHSVLREADEHENGADEFGYSARASVATRSLPSRSKPVSRVGSVRSTGSSFGRYSSYSTSSAGRPARAGSISESSVYAASIGSRPDSDGTAGLMPGIREHDDGVTPTRAAFERTSGGSFNGGSGGDIPHTPSSTTSSGSLPFPATPESGEEIPQLQSAYNQDKTLPPLPLSARVKYPSNLGLRTQSAGLQRPRTFSSSSSVSNNSMLGVPPGDAKSRSASPTSTPRQSLAKTASPAGAPRPSLGGVPRPSLTIPKSPLQAPQSPVSGLPRSTTPLSSPQPSAGQGYTPRPLRLVSLSSPLPSHTLPANISSRPSNQPEVNQSPTKGLQPGEQAPRSGQVLAYNRNLHDQLKLRTLSINTSTNRAPTSAVSPGGTQTLFMSSGAASAPGSAISPPMTTRSQSPLPSPGGEGVRPKPRIGTGMMYRSNLSVGAAPTSRVRVPSTVAR